MLRSYRMIFFVVLFLSLFASASMALTLSESSQSSVQQNPALMQQNPALMQQNPALMQQNPALMQQNPALMQQNPALMQQNPGSEATSSAEKFFSSFPRAISQSVVNVDNVIERNSLIISRPEQALKQFGYDFFTSTSGFASAPFNAPVGEDYVLAPGDTLSVMVWGAVNAAHAATIDRQGEILLPGVGAISVWGQRLEQARQTIRQHFAKYHKNFEMNVSMGALRTVQLYLVGEVVRPGTATVSSLSTVLNALSVAGGPAKNGSLRDVQLLRQGKVVAHIDYYHFLLDGDRSQDVRIMDGDTIFVPVAHAFVGIAGDVRRPAIYELKPGERLEDLLRFAGGVNSTAYLKQVRVERIEAHQGREVLSLNLEESSPAKLQVALQDRDLVTLSPLSPVNDRSVLLSGYVARPGRYPLNEGTRLADLLLNNENLLPGYYPQMAEILRLRPPLYLPERLTVDLGKALALDEKENLHLEPFDEVRLFSTAEMEEIPYVNVTGAVLKPGKYRLFAGMKVKDIVAAAGNLRRSASMSEAELTRFFPEGTRTRTERILIALDRAMAGDDAANLLLQADDALVIRSIPDFAERLSVTLQGEVLYPGDYTISRGERLSSVIARAGGYTSDAYLRGVTFTRESVKAMQRMNIQRLIAEQEFEIMRASQEMASKAMSPDELSAAQAMLNNRQAMLSNLKQIPMLGRMVLHFKPLEELRGSSDDVELMQGDVVMVPKNPQAVTVLGKVYNENSLIYREGKTVSYYLNQVGGPKEEADEEGIFVVRADGTVMSKAQGGWGMRWDRDNWRWIVGGFNAAELYPGDAILVPEKIDKTAFMRDVKDISTIFYQMALGAAAIASF